jgi:BlaI family transcriptional regulator, penicillinase repressor
MISDAENEIMRVLWQAQDALPAEIIQAKLNNDWQPSTVKTLLNRLLSKNAIAAEKDGRRFLYRPLIARDAYVRHETQSFLERVFDGKLAPIVAHFSKHKGLSAADRAALKKLLQELDDEQ